MGARVLFHRLAVLPGEERLWPLPIHEATRDGWAAELFLTSVFGFYSMEGESPFPLKGYPGLFFFFPPFV